MSNFQWPIRVYYEDTDAGGVVYHANYLCFFERARTEWLRACGFEQDQLKDQHRLVFAIRSVTIDYLVPVHFNQSLLVNSEITEFRGASILFSQQITNADSAENQVLCTANIRVACIDTETFTPRPIPKSIKKELLQHV
jgi:acyl-CoA thioester hydrolase